MNDYTMNLTNITINGMRVAGLVVTADGYQAQVIGGSCGRTERRQLNAVSISGDDALALVQLGELEELISDEWKGPGIATINFDADAVADLLASRLLPWDYDEGPALDAAAVGLGTGLEL